MVSLHPVYIFENSHFIKISLKHPTGCVSVSRLYPDCGRWKQTNNIHTPYNQITNKMGYLRIDFSEPLLCMMSIQEEGQHM